MFCRNIAPGKPGFVQHRISQLVVTDSFCACALLNLEDLASQRDVSRRAHSVVSPEEMSPSSCSAVVSAMMGDGQDTVRCSGGTRSPEVEEVARDLKLARQRLGVGGRCWRSPPGGAHVRLAGAWHCVSGECEGPEVKRCKEPE